MADPLSMCASILALLQMSGQLALVTNNYLSAAKDAKKDIKRIRSELGSLDSTLLALQDLLDDDSYSGKYQLSTLGECKNILSECSDLLVDLIKRLEEPVETWQKIQKKLLWPLKEKDISKLLDVLNRSKATISLALDIDKTKITITVKDDVEVIRAHQDEARRQEIISWFSVVNVQSNLADARAMYQLGTGEWFIQGPEFLSWLDGKHKPIWLHGIPGCGKTVLSGTIINEIQRRQSCDPDIGLAYFFFTFNHIEKRSTINMLRSLISQLLEEIHEIPNEVYLFYQKRRKEATPLAKDLLQVLKSLSSSFKFIYIVLDALDESDNSERERECLFEILSEISATQKINLLITSRKEVDIAEAFETLPMDIIGIQNDSVDADIRHHISVCLNTDRALKKWPPSVKLEIGTALVNGSQGMFRWAKCQLDSLKKCRTVKNVKQALSTLPATLDETYDRILLEIPEEDIEIAIKMLTWLSFSVRPMSITELAEAVIVKSGSTKIDPDDRFQEPHDLLTICGSLVTYFEETEAVKLAHYSVKEYLVSERIRKANTAMFAHAMQSAHSYIAETCLTYVLYEVLDNPKKPLDEPEDSFGEYAAEYCFEHLEATQHEERQGLETLAFDILGNLKNFDNWLNRTKDSVLYGNYIRSPISYASYYGLTRVAEKLLSQGANPDDNSDDETVSPLACAALNGQDIVLKLLIKNGACVNTGGFCLTPLIMAAMCGHDSIVLFLLESGANINLRSHSGAAALTGALKNGHNSIALLLLDNGADINIQGISGETALMIAVDKGYDSMVQHLLDNGADTNIKNSSGETALILAARSGHDPIMLQLLKNGADTNILPELSGTALMEAAKMGHDWTVLLLLENGTSSSIRDRYGKTALMLAVDSGHNSTALLLGSDSIINDNGLLGQTNGSSIMLSRVT